MIFASAFTISVAQNDSVTCQFILENNIYSCRIVDAIVPESANRPILVEGSLPLGRSDDDVAAVRIRNGHIPFVINELFVRFANVFRLIVEPSPLNGLSRIQTGAFEHAGNLQWILIGNNPLTTIQANAFHGASSLRTVDLRNNQIQRISVFAFNGLSNLRDLMLENNRIFSIQGNLFKPLTNIELIYLSNNKIESFEGRTFSNNRQLRHVDFTRNPIQEIESSVLDNLENLQIFIAAENSCVSNAWIVASLNTIRKGLSACFENFENIV